ncbi:MAG: LPS assembly lipoprotein LptE [Alphaproteobacteria bacterium]
MWWSRRQALASILAACGLSACGFEPMYGGRRGRVTSAELAAIKVEPIPDRVGQVLRNGLLDRLTPTGEPARPRYKLRVKVVQTTTALAIQPNASVTRFNLSLDVSFTLFDLADGKPLYRDHTRVVGSYNAVRSDFATVVTQQDTAQRAAREASQEVSTLLGVFFARRRASAS